MPIRTLIMGAAGRDFHNFNVASSAITPLMKLSPLLPPRSRILKVAHTQPNWLASCIRLVSRFFPKVTW